MADVAIASRESEHEVSRAAGSCTMVLFGAAGDLTKRKLVAALFNLAKAKLLPQDFAMIGVSVEDLSLDQFRNQVTGFLPAQDRNSDTLRWFTERLHYERGDFADPATYSTLMNRLANLESERDTGVNYLFYLATGSCEEIDLIYRAEVSGFWMESAHVFAEVPRWMSLDERYT